MTKKKTADTPEVAPIAPAFPNASIDFDKVLANDAKGKTGADLLEDAFHLPPQEQPDPDAPAPVDDPVDGETPVDPPADTDHGA